MFTRLFCMALFGLAGIASAASQPTLTHSAPFLGHTLTIDVDAAPPSQTIALLYSPNFGSSATPWGLLELERETSQRIAMGVTDAQGHATFSIPIPANAALAENAAHFQALVDDPMSAAGKTLSEAVHVRLMGTRIYTGLKRSEIEIVSPILDASVTKLSIAPNLWEDGPAVFSDDYSVGAVVARGPGYYNSFLVRFDPFFGSLLGQMIFTQPSSTPLVDATGKRVFILEGHTLISAIDLETGAIVGQLDLPNPTSGIWCSNSRRTEAYVAERLGGLPAVRRVSLETLTDMGSFVVANGDAGQLISSMVFANKTLFVTSEWFGPPASARSALTRIDFSQAPPVVTAQQDDGFMLQRGAAGVSADRFVMIAQQPSDVSFGAPYHHVTSLSQPGPIVNAGYPPFPPGMAFNIDLVVRGSDAWSLGKDADDNDNPVLFRLDLDDLTWSWYPASTWGTGPAHLAKAKDDYVDELYVALWRSPGHPEPRIAAIEQPSLNERSIVLSRDPLTMHAVTVP